MLVPVTISVSHRTANLPPSFAILSMATVIQYPDLMEEICNLLSTSLRRDMIALALKQNMVSSAIPLHNQVTMIGCVYVAIVIQILIKKVILYEIA